MKNTLVIWGCLIIQFALLAILLVYVVKIIYACIILPKRYKKIKSNCTRQIKARVVGEKVIATKDSYFYALIYEYVNNGELVQVTSGLAVSLPILNKEHGKNLGTEDIIYVNNTNTECYSKELIKIHFKSVMIDILSSLEDWSDLRIKQLG